ncbi:MAG TPA: DUF2249 domain-containing protein [Candidatus Baltobacteraceae bacterium]|nr:DUF2249 domain-containing protein [Candidatus Baltobacteraceae bacterium]
MDDLRLDVRNIPPPERHPKIFALFDALPPGRALVLISDHEPRPLRAEFEHKRPDVHQWVQRHLGDGSWEVRLTYFDAHAQRSPVSSTLAKSPVFESVDRAVLDDLAYHVRRVAVKRNQVVAQQAVNWPYIGVVERGVVQAALITPMGREQTMFEVLPGDVFGEIALLDSAHTPLRFVAVTSDTIVLMLPREPVRSAADRFPALMRALSVTGAQHFRIVLDTFAAHISQSTTARVAYALLPYATPALGMSDALDPLPSLTQSEVAMRAGTVKEVVSRALAELETLGALERRGGHIVRLDRARLKGAAAEHD